MKVVFMGTPDFAVPALQKLIESKHAIIGVYTKPPKPAGRGYQELKSKVHLLAEKHNLTVLVPSTLRTDINFKQLQDLQPDVIVVAAYGLILPQSVLDLPKYGCINIHPSKLPRWRGAAPIQHTILSGDKETAVCIMQMDAGLDTGDILLQKDLAVPEIMTAYQLHDKAAQIGGEMVLEVLDILQSGEAKPIKQTEEGLVYATKLNREDELINWEKSAFEINCQIRTFTPRPAAYFRFDNEVIKVIEATYIADSHTYKSGEVVDDNLKIACGGGGFLQPMLLQREGKKQIYTDAFLRGFSIPRGSLLK